eukprot:5575043-Alexandrium_andersonii.AAC.1
MAAPGLAREALCCDLHRRVCRHRSRRNGARQGPQPFRAVYPELSLHEAAGAALVGHSRLPI